MRRLLSYLLLSGAVILGSAVSLSPIMTNMNTDVSYSDGRTLTFRASMKDEGYESKFYDPETITPITNKKDIEAVADIMSTRLDRWGVSEATVNAVGLDTITVTLKAENNIDMEYENIERYLCYSGGNISLSASFIVSTGGSDMNSYPNEGLDDLFDADTKARIEYIEVSNEISIPVTVMKISERANRRQNFLDLISYCEKNTIEDTSSEDSESSGPKEEGTDKSKTCYMLVWGNAQEGDVPSEGSVLFGDPNIDYRIIARQVGNTDNCVWYADNDDDIDEKKYPHMMLLPASMESGDQNAMYREAHFYELMLNAEKLDYQIEFLYESVAEPTVENLITLDWNRSLAWSRTLIASIIAAAFAVLILALFERIFAVSMTATTFGTLIITLSLFFVFRAEFNIAALIGFALIAILSLFGQFYYNSRLKDELYKGRTLKKANQEAGKKAFWPTIDASVISIITGLFVYLLAGESVGKMGIVLVVGGFVSVLMNLIVYRFLSWILTSDSSMQAKFPKLLGVHEDKIPDLLKEEKQSYFGPFANHKFTKGKTVTSIIAGVLIVAGISMMVVFGVTKGTVYNDALLNQDQSVLYLEARSSAKGQEAEVKNDTAITSYDVIYKSYFPNESPDTPSNLAAKRSLLRNIYYTANNETKAFCDLYESEEALFASMTMSETSKRVSDTSHNVGIDASSTIIYDWYFFTVDLPLCFNEEGYENDVFTVVHLDGQSATFNDVNQAFEDLVSEYVDVESNPVLISVKNIKAAEGTPSLGAISLGVGIAILVATVYLMLRYRPSRGFAAGLIALVASFIALAFFVITRIPVAPVVALGSIAVAFVTFLGILFTLGKEKEFIKESREHDKKALEFRTDAINKSASYSSSESILFMLIPAYLAIVFFGCGPIAFNAPYLNLLLGSLISIVLILTLLAPMSGLFAEVLSKMKVKLPKRKVKTGHLQEKKTRSAEPEEATFIGIND